MAKARHSEGDMRRSLQGELTRSRQDKLTRSRSGELTGSQQDDLTKAMGQKWIDLKKEEHFSVVAAIDFGTTYSGYAFSYTSTPNEIKTNTEWGTEVGVTRYKTPTCVLTDNKDRLVSFGYDAMNKYAEELDAAVHFHLYDRFKMHLYREKVIGSKTLITSKSGRVMQAEYIISLGLSYLYKHILQTLQKSNERAIDTKQIRWVLTVPAIWSDSAKQLMRSAAFKAGIIDSLSSKRLLVALEPEAASFWCRQLTLDKFTGTKTTEQIKMVPGTKYLVVDCGGGTIDVTAHQMVLNNKVKEVFRANGGAWGGTTVDDAFIDLMQTLFGADLISKFRRDNPQDWLGMIVQFETKKRSYDPNTASTMNISLSFNFGTTVNKFNKKPVDTVVQRAQMNGVSFKQGYLVLQKNIIEQLYMPSISKIAKHIHGVLQTQSLRDIQYLFLVGGFSDCRFLQQNMLEYFGRKTKVMIPQDAGMAIMRGAVLFGHTPDAVVARIARKTYGECIKQKFDASIHDPKKKIKVDGEEFCGKLFKVWVNKNESVQTGESRTFTSTPFSSKSTVSITYIYSSDSQVDRTTYITDPGVEKVGVLKINIPDTQLEREKRKINKHVFFGGTEIYVCVEDTVRGKAGDSAGTIIDFLAD